MTIILLGFYNRGCERSMPLPDRLVGYIFGYVQKSPRKAEDLQTSAIQAQLRSIKRLEAGVKASIPIVVGWSTNRSTSFASTNRFRTAIEQAQAQDAALVVSDVQNLLSVTRSTLIDACVARLDNLPVELLDLATVKLWSETPEVEKHFLVRNAKQRSFDRSRAVKWGLKESSQVRRAPTTENARRGSRENSRRADKRAEVHRPLVEELMQKQPTGKQLRPSDLRKALNDASIPSATGKQWSDVTAKDLLERLARNGGR